MSKISKSAAGYLPAKLISRHGSLGTSCGNCRDFLQTTSQCRITDDPNVNEANGTCTQFIMGEPLPYGKPLRLVPKEVVGYIEGPDVPTYCGRCKYYSDTGRYKGECEIVSGSIEYGACCNSYQVKEDGKKKS